MHYSLGMIMKTAEKGAETENWFEPLSFKNGGTGWRLEESKGREKIGMSRRREGLIENRVTRLTSGSSSRFSFVLAWRRLETIWLKPIIQPQRNQEGPENRRPGKLTYVRAQNLNYRADLVTSDQQSVPQQWLSKFSHCAHMIENVHVFCAIMRAWIPGKLTVISPHLQPLKKAYQGASEKEWTPNPLSFRQITRMHEPEHKREGRSGAMD